MDYSTVVALVVGTVLTLALAAGLGLLASFLVNWYLQARADQRLRAQRQRELYFAQLRTLDDLLQLTPTAFEHTVAELLRFWGYRDVRHTGGGGDLAADVVCRTPDGLEELLSAVEGAVARLDA
jgi:restriction system protein